MSFDFRRSFSNACNKAARALESRSGINFPRQMELAVALPTGPEKGGTSKIIRTDYLAHKCLTDPFRCRTILS
jgi:hypothetical protein